MVEDDRPLAVMAFSKAFDHISLALQGGLIPWQTQPRYVVFDGHMDTVQAEPKVFVQTLVMTLASGARSAGQRERCGQKNCKNPALSVVVHVCRYVDVLCTHTCAVTECSFVCTFGSSYRVPETSCVHPFTSSLFSPTW